MENISVIGLGFVGSSIVKSLKEKKCSVIGYDKYKDSDELEDCLKTTIMFLCLPTQFSKEINEYDKSVIEEVCEYLEKKKYSGVLVLKSTVEPGTTEHLLSKFPNLNLIHNPEFLSAKTAYTDFHNQQHIVLGKPQKCEYIHLETLRNFYSENYPDAEISLCSSIESESMKLFVNCFYSVKIQFFNELYLLCEKQKCDYNKVKKLMLKNKWINPMHTNVPGNDGILSYGGYCFPKDTNALLNHMKKLNVPHKVMEATIEERNSMRNDDTNIIND